MPCGGRPTEIDQYLTGADLNLELSSLVDCGLNIYRRLSILRRTSRGSEQILDFLPPGSEACRDVGAAYDSIDAVLAVGFDNVAQLWNRWKQWKKPAPARISLLYRHV